MIKLLDILKEITEGKAIELPEEESKKVEELYPKIKNNLKDLISKAPKDISNPLIPSNLRNYFEITPIGQKPLFVSVGLYNDPSDFAAGKGTQATDMDLKIDLAKKHILINLAHFDNSDEQQFEELVTHELKIGRAHV